jgi:predicted transcriptional regulator
MAKSKPRISLIRLIQVAYIIRLILGRPLYEVIADFIRGGGSITDQVLDLAVVVLTRLEEEGVEIIVNATVVSYVIDKIIIPTVGHRKLIDVGFAVVTL